MKSHPILAALCLAALIFILCWSLLDGLDRHSASMERKIGRTVADVLRDHGQKDVGDLRIVYTAPNLITVHKQGEKE
jgi:hypothetical protein